MGSGCIAPIIPQHLMEVKGQPHTTTTSPLGKEPSLNIEQEVRWALQLVWTFQRREKSPAPTRIWPLNHSVNSLFTSATLSVSCTTMELHLCSPSMPSWYARGQPFTFYLHFICTIKTAESFIICKNMNVVNSTLRRKFQLYQNTCTPASSLYRHLNACQNTKISIALSMKCCISFHISKFSTNHTCYSLQITVNLV